MIMIYQKLAVLVIFRFQIINKSRSRKSITFSERSIQESTI